jgi:hypothetical protein
MPQKVLRQRPKERGGAVSSFARQRSKKDGKKGPIDRKGITSGTTILRVPTLPVLCPYQTDINTSPRRRNTIGGSLPTDTVFTAAAEA